MFLRHPADGAAAVQSTWDNLNVFVDNLPVSVGPDQLLLQQDAFGLEGAVAQADVRFDEPDSQPRGIIRFSQVYLTKPPEEQRLTLLHELIHIRLLGGPCRCRMERADEINAQHRLFKRITQDGRDFESEQVALARYLYLFPDEVMAEKYLSVSYPAIAAQRMQQYATIQAESWEAGEQNGGRSELRAPRLLLLWLRNQLGALLTTGDVRAVFESRTNILVARMTEVLSGDEREGAIGLANRVLVAAHDGSSWDEDAANELFDWVIGIEYVPTPAV